MILQGKAKYPVRKVILHCAAINSGQFKGWTPFQVFSEINRWHKQRGFKSFGYHGLITPEGEFYKGRPYTEIGAHCIEANRGSLGFLLIESVKITELVRVGKPGDEPLTYRKPRFDDWYTQAQAAKLRAVLKSLPGIQTVEGHNDYAPRLCPGFKVYTEDWLPAR